MTNEVNCIDCCESVYLEKEIGVGVLLTLTLKRLPVGLLLVAEPIVV